MNEHIGTFLYPTLATVPASDLNFAATVKVRIVCLQEIIHKRRLIKFSIRFVVMVNRVVRSIRFIPGLFAFMQGRDLYICLDFGIIRLVLWEAQRLQYGIVSRYLLRPLLVLQRVN